MTVPPHRKSSYDAIVIGGGPAGSAYAHTLRRRGHSVLLLERTRFPRFHIGESLLTGVADTLEHMGLLHRVAAQGFPVKTGVELTGDDGSHRRIAFADMGDDFRDSTFHVERADFDKILLDAAAEAGAEVVENAQVSAPLMNGDRVAGVRYKVGGSTYEAPASFVADASGRAGVLARRFGLRKSKDELRMAAVFKHFGGLDEKFNPGTEGDIQLCNHKDGWVWAIPIRKDVISVGAVTPQRTLRSAPTPEDLFNEHVNRIPRVRERITGTEVVRELTGETDYSYHADRIVGPGFFLLGDAACFTDPIFSGGLFLALISGIRAAEQTSKIISGREEEAEAQEYFANFYKTGFETYHRLIRAFYDNDYVITNYMQDLFAAGMHPRWVARTLNGDFWSKDNVLVNAMRSEERWKLFEDFEPVYRPLFRADD
ncbi:NAD(P)/FAD-dependent oxidoreductase [Nocardiopsis halophila]|uniref:NAD(P)/FAD-dependent oxidoreductase n=1 Tax=Nocardiopsis halophila TaxID=141692 RepID=UPI00034B9A85|nr:NAD(P)/FAD-dependent oxidoreductase [Nocardiopsis halophila]